MKAHSTPVTALAFSPDGKFLVSYACGENKLSFWQTSTGQYSPVIYLSINFIYLLYSPFYIVLSKCHSIYLVHLILRFTFIHLRYLQSIILFIYFIDFILPPCYYLYYWNFAFALLFFFYFLKHEISVLVLLASVPLVLFFFLLCIFSR